MDFDQGSHIDKCVGRHLGAQYNAQTDGNFWNNVINNLNNAMGRDAYCSYHQLNLIWRDLNRKSEEVQRNLKQIIKSTQNGRNESDI